MSDTTYSVSFPRKNITFPIDSGIVSSISPFNDFLKAKDSAVSREIDFNVSYFMQGIRFFHSLKMIPSDPVQRRDFKLILSFSTHGVLGSFENIFSKKASGRIFLPRDIFHRLIYSSVIFICQYPEKKTKNNISSIKNIKRAQKSFSGGFLIISGINGRRLISLFFTPLNFYPELPFLSRFRGILLTLKGFFYYLKRPACLYLLKSRFAPGITLPMKKTARRAHKTPGGTAISLIESKNQEKARHCQNQIRLGDFYVYKTKFLSKEKQKIIIFSAIKNNICKIRKILSEI